MRPRQHPHSVFVVLAAGLLSLAFVGQTHAQVQQKVLYNFCPNKGCLDGAGANGDLIFDSAGDLYGTTFQGGANCFGGCGTVFQLSPSNGSWSETVLYSFCAGGIQNCPDGAAPQAGLVTDTAGNLYGTTKTGGTFGLGTVFELIRPSRPGAAWTEVVLWSFGGQDDGQLPLSRLTFDLAGNLYGTTQQGGPFSGGTVFQLITPKSGTQWTENVLYAFGSDHFNGYYPTSAITFDAAGNLYSTTSAGGAKEGSGLGVVFKLSPSRQAPWALTVLFRFSQRSGGYPFSGINFDSLGNLYGTVSEDAAGYGAIYRLTPKNGGSEKSMPFLGTPDGSTPLGGVLVRGSTLYGVTHDGGAQNKGTVFRVNGKKDTILYDFCSQPNCVDGSGPSGNLTLHARSLFGVTQTDGEFGKGVVFQISIPTPSRRTNISRRVIARKPNLASASTNSSLAIAAK